MSSQSVHVRQEHLQSLGRFSLALVEALGRSAIPTDMLRPALRTAMSGECVQCGIRVTGEELLALAELTDGNGENPRLARLRQGYCARNGCDSYYYRLTFTGHPAIDWIRLLSQTDSVSSKQAGQTAAESAADDAIARNARRRFAARVLIGLVGVALLLIIRQLYVGGSIPLIREPENFQVDHIPDAQSEAR